MSQTRKPQKGIPFEEAVAAIQKLLDVNASVTHNERLIDRLGHSRQYDVVIRGRVGGHEILGVVECKDLSRPVGTPEINAYADKVNNLRANFSVMVSRRGFSQPAIELAQHHGIGTFSLIQEDLEEDGFSIAVPAYGEFFRWEDPKGTLYTVRNESPPENFTLTDIAYYGQSVWDWFRHKLSTDYKKFEGSGVCTWHLRLIDPSAVTVCGVPVGVGLIKLEATRIREVRTKRVRWLARAFYDWANERIIVPPNQGIGTEPIRIDLSDWEIWEHEIPNFGGKFGEMRFKIFASRDSPQAPTLALEQAINVEFKPPT